MQFSAAFQYSPIAIRATAMAAQLKLMSAPYGDAVGLATVQMLAYSEKPRGSVLLVSVGAVSVRMRITKVEAITAIGRLNAGEVDPRVMTLLRQALTALDEARFDKHPVAERGDTPEHRMPERFAYLKGEQESYRASSGPEHFHAGHRQ